MKRIFPSLRARLATLRDNAVRRSMARAARRHWRREVREMERVALLFENFDQLAALGAIDIDHESQTVTIAADLAERYLFDRYSWTDFLGKAQAWATFRLQTEAYRRSLTRHKADAEAAAYRRNPRLTADERRAVRVRAAAAFDAASAGLDAVADAVQFVVVGTDGDPLVVARRVHGRFETGAVPELVRDAIGLPPEVR